MTDAIAQEILKQLQYLNINVDRLVKATDRVAANSLSPEERRAKQYMPVLPSNLPSPK